MEVSIRMEVLMKKKVFINESANEKSALTKPVHKITHWKKCAAMGLSMAITAGTLAGCGSSGGNSFTAGTNTDSSNSAANTSDTANGNGAAGEKTFNGVDISEHVDLKMYLLGDRTPDFDEVYGKINEILEEKLNCSISVDFLSWGEHDTKYSLLFSSQEPFDLIFTASGWAHYEQTVSLGGFYALSEEFIQTYAPDIWNVVPEMAWNQAKVDNTIYMVPNYQNEFGQDIMAVRGDLMEKYGFEDIATWDDLRNFYMTIAEKEDGIYASQGGPWYQYFHNKGMYGAGGTPNNGELILYNTQNPENLEFTYIVEWDGFREYCMQAKEMADAGCWSRDVLNSTEERQTGFLNGNAAAMIWNRGSCLGYAKQANKEHPEWKATICDCVSNQPKKVNSYINNGVAININSKNPERAMMVLNEFYTNPAVYDLAMLGIEGKHWEAVGSDQYKIIDETNFGADSNCNWGWKNADINRTEFIEDRTEVDDTYDAMVVAWDNNVKAEHVYDGFSFNTAPVQTQVAAVEAALGTYYSPLINGMVDDVDATIAELGKVLDQAGMQDIIKELEKQAAEYVASK